MKMTTILFAALFAAARAAFGAPCPPVEYELLQYVATDGNLKPYVDTGHRPTSNTKVAIDMAFLGAADTYTASEWIAIWGYRKTYKTDMFAFFVKKDASQVALNYKMTDVQPASGILLGERFIFRNDNARQYVTRVERGEQETCIHSAADQSFAAGSGWTITIFGMRGTTVSAVDCRNVKMRLYGCRIWEGDELVRDFVPVRRVADSAVGLYDLAGGGFYPNKGTGALVAGPAPAMRVDGSPVRYTRPAPYYGQTTALEPGVSYAFSAPASWTNEAGNAAADCLGFRLDLADGTSVTCAATSTNITYSAELAGATLTWLWREKYRVVATADAGLTAAASPEWVASGETATLSVAEDTALFACWTGDVPAADTFRPTFALTVDAPKTIRAGAVTAIRYVAPGGTGDGTSWASPLGDVRAALLSVADLASGASLICVKEGLHIVTNAAAVTMSAPVAVRGGYAGDGFARGGETVLARTNGAPQSAILAFAASTLELASLTISNGWSQASPWGQGIALQGGCTATIRDCRFDRNGNGNLKDTTFYGGAVGAENGTLRIDGCDFTRNSLHAGDGNVRPCGGAVGANGARVRISNSTFDRNYTQSVHARYYGGGAIGAISCPSVEIDHCTFTTNYARTSSGGGNYLPAEQYGYGPYGGTVYISGSASAAIRDCTFLGGWNASFGTGRMTWGWGGLMYFYNSAVTLERTAIHDAGDCGYTSGGLYNWSQGSIDVRGGSLTMRNVLHGHSYSGWLLGNNGGAVSAENCTFAGARQHGNVSRKTAAYVQRAGSATFRNCIFWNNHDGDCFLEDGADPVFEYCLTQTPRTGVGNLSEDPLFGDELHYHPVSPAGRYAGGFFAGGSWTIDEETSPAIDAGDPATPPDDEPQPNLGRVNLGYDGGTAAASKSVCGDPPVVDPAALQIFAYEATDFDRDGATLTAHVASLGGGADATVTVVWGDSDHGTDLAAWGANAATLSGAYAPWQLASHKLAGVAKGTWYYRFRAANDKGEAWSNPARSFTLGDVPTLAYAPDAPITHLYHRTARINAVLTDNGGMATTIHALYWPVSDPASALRADVDYGHVIPEGPVAVGLAGLTPGETYAYCVIATNVMGATCLPTNTFTTLSSSTPVVLYVAPAATGRGDGSSFAHATDDLQWATDQTELAGDEIRLVAGTNTLADTVDVANHPGLVIRGGYTADDVRGGWSCLRRDTSRSRKYRILAASASALLVDSVEIADGSYETPGTYYGQGVSLMNACAATFTNCLFRDNGVAALVDHSAGDGTTSQYGGALGASGGTLTVVDCAFRNNRIWGGNWNTRPFGGAIGASGAALTVLRSSFDANCTQTTHSRLGGGGAIAVVGGSATIAECHFTTNYCRTSTGNARHGYTQTGPFGGTLHFSGTTATVTDCDITGGWLSNGTQGGIYYGVGGLVYVAGAASDVVFDRVRVDDCGFTGSTGNTTLNPQTQNDFCVASGKLTVKNGLFTRAYGSTQFCNRGGVLNVVNCTVTGGRGLATSRSQQTFVHTAGTTTNRNTIVWGNTGDALYVEAGATEPAVICCDMEEADPLFRDTTAGDYHLKPGSPVRDKGDKTGFTRADIDLDHDKRIRGGRPDLGCFEGSLAGLFLIVQ